MKLIFFATSVIFFALCAFAGSATDENIVDVIVTGIREGKVGGCGCNSATQYNIAKEAAVINKIRSENPGHRIILIDVERTGSQKPDDYLIKYLKLMKYDVVAYLDDWEHKSDIRTTKKDATTTLLDASQGSREVQITQLAEKCIVKIGDQAFTFDAPGKVLKIEISGSGKDSINKTWFDVNTATDEDFVVKKMLTERSAEAKAELVDMIVHQAKNASTKSDPIYCGGCHAEAYASWLRSKHSHATKVLIESGRVEAECITCHSTAFSRGFKIEPDAARPEDAVTCVSCHDIDGEHGKNPNQPFRESLDATTCVGCHNAENSPKFNWHEYKTKVHPGKVNH